MHDTEIIMLAIVLLTLLVFPAITLIFLMVKLNPDEIAVNSGIENQHKSAIRHGGYQIFKEGILGNYIFRTPKVMQVDRMDISPIMLSRTVKGISTSQDDTVNIELKATIGFDTSAERIFRPVELFLGVPREYVEEVAASVIESSLRAAASPMTAHLSETLRKSAAPKLEHLGLVLTSIEPTVVS